MTTPQGSYVARVVVASNRAADGIYPDRTGPLIVDWLAQRSFDVAAPIVVHDGQPVTEALRRCVADGADLVITTGGTGISPTDRTPEATAAVLDYEIPGLADAVRDAGLPEVPSSVLSRGTAGVAGRTLVVNLPGSTGGVRDGLAVLDGVLNHAMEQLAGGDHVPQDTASERVAVPVCEVTDQLITAEDHAARVADRSAGAVVSFAGAVRDHDGGKQVSSLFYEGHPTAKEVLENLVAEVTGRHPRLRALAVSHRIGALEIGDVALACAVAADHRGEAFAACSDLVDTVKQRLPIWKHQVFADGTDEWVNSP
jgi:molybdenum cofactor synthesis domain-containing protein